MVVPITLFPIRGIHISVLGETRGFIDDGGVMSSLLLVFLAIGGSVLLVPQEYGTIQSAVDAAADGDTVLVSPGTYTENIEILGKSLDLTSESGCDETVIDGSSSGAVVFVDCPDDTVLIKGFEIMHGSASGVRDFNGYLRIHECRVSGNWSANYAGGIDIGEGNRLELVSSELSGNSTDHCGGGLRIDGSGGLFCWNCTFQYNSADDFGGGLYHNFGQDILVRNCHFIGNSSYDGGGICLVCSFSPLIENCLIVDNTAERYGGGIYVDHVTDVPSGSFVNCTVSGNNDFGGAGGLYQYGGIVSFVSCILQGNDGYDAFLDGQMYVTFSRFRCRWTCIEQLSSVHIHSGLGEFRYADLLLGNPGFIPGPLSDYHLSESSICIDAGCPEYSFNDFEDTGVPGYALWPAQGTTRNDMGTYGGPFVAIWNPGSTGLTPGGGSFADDTRGLTVMSNPVIDGLLAVRLPSGIGYPAEFLIYDTGGRLVQSCGLFPYGGEEMTIDVRRLPDGLYICSVEAEDGSYQRMFTVLRE